MEISSSSLAFSSRHSAFRHSESRVSLQRAAAVTATDVQRAAQADNVRSPAAAANADEASAQVDERYAALIRLVEMLTGEQVRLFDAGRLQSDAASAGSDPAASSAPTLPGASFSFEAERRSVESEATSVCIAGQVQTADGQQLSFEFELQMERFHAESERLAVRIGPAAQRKDPLVINLGGNGAGLVDGRFQFDLDADGATEALPGLVAGTAFVVLDRNGNGRIDDGRELFGALSGDGFADLAQFDLDGNGWIDGADPVLSQLGVWDGRGAVQRLESLGVAALSTQRIASPFALRGDGNSDLGALRTTGLYLVEDGRVGSLQQIDLTV